MPVYEPSPTNYEQATAWLREANTAGDDRFGPADKIKHAAWTATAQVFALLAIADAINELRKNVSADLGSMQSQLESLTFAVDRLHDG